MQQHLTAQEWARRVQLDRAQVATAHGITHTTGAKVGGAHLSDAANEPDPTTADDSHLAEVAEPVESATEYAQRKARENDRRALAAQVMNLDAMRRAGL